MIFRSLAVLFLSAAVCAGLYAQGFGFDDDAGDSAASGVGGPVFSPPISVKISGEVGAAFTGYVHDFSSVKKMKATSLGDVFSGSLDFSASGSNVDAFIGFNLSAASFEEYVTPLFIDEAYLRAYFGPVSVEGGLRKLTWGKADSLGPLDVTNPMDYTDLRDMADIQSVKIARPMAHISWKTGDFSKLETVFIPTFAGHRYAQDAEDRWTPGRISGMTDMAAEGMYKRALEVIPVAARSFIASMYPQMMASFADFSPEFPNTNKLEYFQTGLRFTTTIGPADFGMQYYYGSLFQPDFSIVGVDDFFIDLLAGNNPPNPADPYFGNPDILSPQIKYNRYHQLGIDYAQVLLGFNIRSECAVFLTKDLKGADGSVRNPFIGWSFGFDRDIVWGINANIQCNETVRLLDDKVGSNPVLDCEAGTDITSTRFTARISKKFFRDELESRATVIWNIENSDCYVIPAIIWTIGDVTAELSAGVFAGDKTGDFGQYWKNNFVKIGLSYSF